MKSQLEQIGHASTDRVEYEPDRVFDIQSEQSLCTNNSSPRARVVGWGGVGVATLLPRSGRRTAEIESCKIVLQANTTCHPNDGFDSDRWVNVASMSRRTLITYVFID